MQKMQWIRNESIYCIKHSELRRSEQALNGGGRPNILLNLGRPRSNILFFQCSISQSKQYLVASIKSISCDVLAIQTYVEQQ